MEAIPRQQWPSKQSRPRSVLILAAIMAVLVTVAAIVSYDVGYNLGYSKGYDHGFQNAQVEQIIQSGTRMPLSPGAEFSMEILQNRIGIFTVSGTVGFNVLPYLQANATAELYVQHGPMPLFNTSYVETEHNIDFTLSVNTGQPTTIIVRANPRNLEVILLLWDAPLLLSITPPL